MKISVVLGVGVSGLLMASEPATLETPSGTLYGTLEVPSSKGRFPVVLMHAGSGPTDRDGNSAALPGKNDSLKMLAEQLALQGIASLRYDKRGVGASAKAASKESDTRFETYIDDVVSWGEQLHKNNRFNKLALLGHSEGALIMCVAAQRVSNDAYISIAGAGRPAGTVILEQLRHQLPPDLMQQADEIVGSLNRGQTVDKTPSELAMLFRNSVQPYLISWFKYDPRAEIAKLKMPVLILQGDTDIQVQVADAERLAEAQPAAKVVVIEGMNHVFKLVKLDRTKQVDSYSDPGLPVAPRLVEEIASFLKTITGKTNP
jgi:alpha-beta hydrolase superfamily lysophospholipase